MKLKGKLSNWNDDKGFGFVEPYGGGERAFVHIKAFKSRSRRPISGDAIAYELCREKNNRYKAEKVTFLRDLKSSNRIGGTVNVSAISVTLVAVFCIGLIASVVGGQVPFGTLWIYMAMSAIAFVAYALDKSAAKNGRWRTKEKTLHLFSLMGGWPGAYLAQTWLRHKSTKRGFKHVYWLTVLLNLMAFFWLYTGKGGGFLATVIIPLFDR
jgi:uncharacterized membrane protein YsdA (DUF1294 family)/cold shock CspA family protein